MGERTVRMFAQAGGESYGILPLPADHKPGEYTVELLDQAGSVVSAAPVRVVDAHFSKQNVTIAPEIAELKPSPGETETVAAFRNSISDVRYWSEPLEMP